MKRKQRILTWAALAAVLLLGACTPRNKALDRQGLVDLMHSYLAAMVQHDPAMVPLADEVAFVENTVAMDPGQGLWETASAAPGDFQIHAADPVAQQVASLVLMKENGDKNCLAGIRLKVVDGRITEAEHLIVRDDGLREASLANLQAPRPALLEDVPPAEQTTRDDLIRIGLTYYDALTGEDGTLTPFANDCERRENGMTTAGEREPLQTPVSDNPEEADPEMIAMFENMSKFPRSCEGQISTGTFAYITDIKERRIPVADEQKGLAVGFSMFWHDGSLKEMEIKGVDGVTSVAADWGQFNLPAMHIYKISNGQIHEIEAIGNMMPYGTTSGW